MFSCYGDLIDKLYNQVPQVKSIGEMIILNPIFKSVNENQCDSLKMLTRQWKTEHGVSVFFSEVIS